MRRDRLGLATPLLVAAILVTALGPAERAATGPFRAHRPDGLRSDFNADGFSDLAVSVSREDVGSIVDAGAVGVLYGSAQGLQADRPDDQFWTQGSGGLQEQPEPDDRFGEALAAGDFNGDGFADLAVGAPFEDLSGAQDGGAVAVLYGSASGLQAAAPDDQLWTQDSSGVEDQVEAGDEFGKALAAGDFNGDGFADLAIGAAGETLNAATDAGAVSVLSGSPAGLQTADPPDQFWNQATRGVKGTPSKDDRFGQTLVSADFDGNGVADLGIGVAEEAVNLLYGTGGGLQADDPDDQLWSQDSPGVKEQTEGDGFASALAAADFNGDGFADLAVGAWGEDGWGFFIRSDSGAVNVLYGTAGGLQANDPDDQLWSQRVAHVRDQLEEDDNFGYALTAADFNADGFADLVVGIPGEDYTVGAVQVFYGSPAGLQADAPDDQVWREDSPEVRDAGEGFEYFGIALSQGDFDGDGFADLAVSVPGQSLFVGFVGQLHVLYATAQGIQAVSPDDQVWNQDSPGVQDAAEEDDLYSGYALGSGISPSARTPPASARPERTTAPRLRRAR